MSDCQRIQMRSSLFLGGNKKSYPYTHTTEMVIIKTGIKIFIYTFFSRFLNNTVRAARLLLAFRLIFMITHKSLLLLLSSLR
jgi:hypothetical protein